MNRNYSISVALMIAMAIPGMAQVSTGADGRLDLGNDRGVVIFDPVALGLDMDGDNVFHFTTIYIQANTTLRIKASKMRKNGPVVFLATGDVQFGTNAGIDVSGEDGVAVSTPVQILRRPAEPGPGGYAGGVGSRTDTSSITPAADGFGPLGSRGVAATSGCFDPLPAASAQSIHMNISMIPLVGGAGGAGGYCATAGQTGGNGGAGGGALRIVSATLINFVGGSLLNANGGTRGPANQGTGGNGSGGMIHLIAPQVTFAGGVLTAIAPAINSATPLTGGGGIIRINATTTTGIGTAVIRPTPVLGPLYTLPLPSGNPEVTITQVNGVNVASPPSGQVTGLDVVVNASGASTVTIAAKNIPLGTVVNLRISSEIVMDQSITCSPLTGAAPASSSATCTATFPLGANITIASASW